MDSEDIMNGLYLIQGVANVGALFFGYKWGLGFLNDQCSVGSEKIRDKKHLEEMLVEERMRLKIPEEMKINILDESDLKGSYSYRFENEGGIYLQPKDYDRMTLRHELFHIAENHSEIKRSMKSKFSQAAAYLFYIEPKTVLHCLKSREEEKF